MPRPPPPPPPPPPGARSRASLTVSGRPPNGLPLRALTAAWAWASVASSTKAQPPGLPVGDDLHLLDLAPLLLEEGAQLRLVALVGQVAYVQSLSHSNSRTNEDAADDPPPFPCLARPCSTRASSPSRLGGRARRG